MDILKSEHLLVCNLKGDKAIFIFKEIILIVNPGILKNHYNLWTVILVYLKDLNSF